MKLGPIVIESAAKWPFYREIHRMIQRNPRYEKGIREGTVHIKFRPGHGPKEDKNETPRL